MVRTLCTTGNHEALKGGVHGVACVIAGVMAAYNIAACCFRSFMSSFGDLPIIAASQKV